MYNYKKLIVIFMLSILSYGVSMMVFYMHGTWFGDVVILRIPVYDQHFTGQYFSYGMETLLRAVGTLAFPIAAYVLVMDIKAKENYSRNLIILGLIAIISQYFYSYVYNSYHFVSVSFVSNTNLFYTLFLGAACIITIEKYKRVKRRLLALIPMLFVPLIFIIPNSATIYPIIAIVSTHITMHFLEENNCDIQHSTGTIATIKKYAPLVLIVFVFQVLAGSLLSFYSSIGIVLIVCLYVTSDKPKSVRLKILSVVVLMLNFTFIAFVFGVLINDSFNMHINPLVHGTSFLIFTLISVLIICILEINYSDVKENVLFKVLAVVFYPVHLIGLYILTVAYGTILITT